MVLFVAIEDFLKKISQFNEYSRALVTLASAVGVLVVVGYVLYLTIRLVQVLRLYVFNQFCCQKNFVEKYGQWAVVTGSTDGIGQSMAKELASRGMSIIVVGRNEEKLARTKTMLQEIPNVGEVETVRVDLSDSSQQNFENIRAQIDPENRDIGILINNAGTFPAKFQRFIKYDMEYLTQLVNLNCITPMSMTCMIMPAMIKRGRGLLMNVSSGLGAVTTPYLSAYGPSKAFIDSFTRQLQLEYSSHPLDIILLTPGPVQTKLLEESSKTTKIPLFIPSSDEYARSAINAISSGINTYSGVLAHGFASLALRQADNWGFMDFAMKSHMHQNAINFELSPVPKRKRVQISSEDNGNQATGITT